MRKQKVGLFVGKFIAFHKGHEYYIQKFAANCDRLNLILCGNSLKDRVPLAERKKWIELDMKPGMPLSCVKNKIKFHTLIEDNITPYPEGIIEWCGEVENLIGEKIDVIFGNDDYVRECAVEFGSYYSSPDQERETFNISSTKILDNVLKYYDLITDVAKPYFNKKVLILGPESTGKSVLTKQLALYFKGNFIEEYGRTLEQQTIRKQGRRATDWTINEYENVASWQNELINSAMQKPCRLLFIDTDALITQLFCELYIKQNSPTLDHIIANQKFDLILYLDPLNTKWVNDGIRMLQSERDNFGKMIREKLEKHNREYIVLTNEQGYDHRLEQAKEIIKHKFNILH